MRELSARITLIALVAFSAVSTDLYLSGIRGIVAALGVGHAESQLTLINQGGRRLRPCTTGERGSCSWHG